MKLTNYTVQVIEPEVEGNFLTQSVAGINVLNQVFSKKVYLGINDSASNWKEITAAEVDEIKAKQIVAMRENQHNN